MKDKILILVCLVSLGLSIYVIYSQKSEKVGYINIREVYENFEMKKQMEEKYRKTKTTRDKILDSLTFHLNGLLKQIDAEKQKDPATIQEFERKREEFLQKKNSFEEDNNALSQKYDQEILTQLNQYVKDFGIKNNYTVIHGNDGNGYVMYADERLNITKEVSDYVNSKYSGAE